MNIGVAIFNLGIIKNMYSNQIIKVDLNGAFSSAFNLKNGLCQGGILLPLFFLIFTLIL